MDLVAVGNLAPFELCSYLDAAITTGRAQSPLTPADLNASYLGALDRAAVAAARVRVWSNRRTSAATNCAIYSGLTRSRSIGRNQADIAEPVDDYSGGIAECFEALSEAGALLQRTAIAAENRTKGLRR